MPSALLPLVGTNCFCDAHPAARVATARNKIDANFMNHSLWLFFEKQPKYYLVVGPVIQHFGGIVLFRLSLPEKRLGRAPVRSWIHQHPTFAGFSFVALASFLWVWAALTPMVSPPQSEQERAAPVLSAIDHPLAQERRRCSTRQPSLAA